MGHARQRNDHIQRRTGKVRTTIVVLLVAAILCQGTGAGSILQALGLQARAAYASDGTGNLEVGGEIFYDNGTWTHQFTVDGVEAYCVNPTMPAPGAGSYPKVDPVLTEPSRANELRADVWFSYGGPGFDSSIWPSSWVDGTPMTPDRYRALAHILIADTAASDAQAALHGCSPSLKNWVRSNVLGFGETGTEINASATGRQIARRQGEIPDNRQFNVFMLSTGGKTQYIVSYRYTPDVETSFTKESADGRITAGNQTYAYGGATYEVYKRDTDSYVTTITTDDQGRASCMLEPNTGYYAVETKAPQGFTINPKRIAFDTGSDGGTHKLSDAPGTVTLSINKRDAANRGDAQPGAALEGAEYSIVSLSTPGWKQTGTTDKNGTLRIEQIPLGRIAVTETKAPRGYKLDPTPHEYEVRADQLTDAGVFELAPQDDFREVVKAFDIDLVKYVDGGNEGSGLQQPAKGVQFQIISNSTGDVVGTLTTNERGWASTSDAGTVNAEAVAADKTHDPSKPWMGEGKRTEAHAGALPYDAKGYTVHEVESTTPEGYQPCPDWQIGAGQMVDGTELHYIVDNDFVSSRIQIVKMDAESGQDVPLAGFTFQLLDKNKKPVTQEVWYPNHTELSQFTTNESGRVTLPGALKPGTYYIREIAAAAPYLLNGEDVKVVIENSANTAPVTVVRMADARARGKATIRKACAGEECPWCDEGAGLEGAEFDVMALEDVIGPDGSVQAVEGEVLDHVTTGEDGTATTEELPLGSGTVRYAFVETKAPAGHQLDSTPVEFELIWADDKTEVVHAEVTAKNTPTETVVDKAIMGTNHPLTGAEFDLWPDLLEGFDDEIAQGSGALAINLANAGIEDGSEQPSISLTQHHEYAEITVEVPDGYQFDLVEPGGVEAKFQDTTTCVQPATWQLSLKNRDGIKVDLVDEALIDVEAGKRYTARYSEGVLGWGAGLSWKEATMERASYTEEQFAIGYDTASIKDVQPGTYRLAIKINDRVSSLTLDVEMGSWSHVALGGDGALRTTSHTLIDGAQSALNALCERFGIAHATNDRGTIAIHHIPARIGDLTPLLEEALAQAGRTPAEIENILADVGSDEQIAWRVQETKAPDGFLVDPDVRTFTIHDDGTTEGEPSHHLHVEDDHTKVEISKRDIANEDEVAGAKLTITDAEGNVIDSWVSTKEPHRIDALAPGYYTLTEEMTPNGYDKAEDVEFTVLPTGEVQRVVMHDEPIRISGEIDKRQEIADPTAEGHEGNGDLQNRADVTASDEGPYDYSLDYRSTSGTWVDEFTVEDELACVEDGTAELVGVTTAQGSEDYDGLMNVWFTTDQTPADYMDGSGANATLTDGHENPWLADEACAERLGEDGRAIDYTGWRLWKEGVSAAEATELKVSDLGLAEGERVTGIRFEYGRVEEGFTTRAGDWGRADIKSGHDDLDDVQTPHLEHGADTMPFAPAIMHMRATDAYVEGSVLENSARVDLIRNGGGDGLEGHDEDFVTQSPRKTPAAPPVTPVNDTKPANLAQTGSARLMLALVLLGMGVGAAGIYVHRRNVVHDRLSSVAARTARNPVRKRAGRGRAQRHASQGYHPGKPRAGVRIRR